MVKSWKKRIAELLTVTMILTAVPFPAAAGVFPAAGGYTAGAVSPEAGGLPAAADPVLTATESNALTDAGVTGKVTVATADNAEMSEDDPDGAVTNDLAGELPEEIVGTLAPAAAQLPAEEEDEEIGAPEMIHVSLAGEELPDNAEMLEDYLGHLAAGDRPCRADVLRHHPSGRDALCL